MVWGMNMSLSTARVVFGFGADSADPVRLLPSVQSADRLGLDHFSVSDHPYQAKYLDAYAALAFLLGRTEHISGFVNVTNLPTRPPAVLARTITTLSTMTGGRVALGMGAGGIWDRITDLGVDRLSPAAAVEAFEEAIVLIRQLSSPGPAVTFSGKHYRVNAIDPVPIAPLPIWTGSVGPRSLAATGRVADGWIPGHAADWLSERFRQSRPLVDKAAVAAGRSPADIRTIYNLAGNITAEDLPRTRDDSGRWVGGSPEQWVEELTSAVLEHGAGGFTLFTGNFGSLDERSLKVWASQIAPAVRSAVAAAD